VSPTWLQNENLRFIHRNIRRQQAEEHQRTNKMLVKIKWNKQVFDNVDIDPEAGVEIFKSQIFSLTGQLIDCELMLYHSSFSGVPMDRQKLMCKGGWTGTLKDDADLTKLNIKDGALILLMGTAESVVVPEIKVM
jgi:ubiquitin carboxyl-terminal hydrolase 14